MVGRRPIVECIEALGAEIEQYFADAHPSVQQEFRRPIDNSLKDARMFANSERQSLRAVQMCLSLAESMFASAKKQLNPYGGPKKARVYPSTANT